MGVYIKGMEMPKEYAVIIKIYPDGRIGKIPYVQWFQTDLVEGVQAVPVPPHGRLIDADELLQSHSVSDGIYFPDAYIPATAIKAAPTIIPAEEADCHSSDAVTGSQ